MCVVKRDGDGVALKGGERRKRLLCEKWLCQGERLQESSRKKRDERRP